MGMGRSKQTASLYDLPCPYTLPYRAKVPPFHFEPPERNKLMIPRAAIISFAHTLYLD